MRPYKVVHSKSCHIGRFEICMDTISIGEKEYPYSYTRVNESVAVLPIWQGKAGLIRQYRHSVDKWLLEVAAGGVEAYESPEAAAVRELREETGFVVEPSKLVYLGALYPVSGTSNERMHFFAGNAFDYKEPKREETEFIENVLVTFDEWEQMIEKGSFCNVYGIALLHKYRLWLEKGGNNELRR